MNPVIMIIMRRPYTLDLVDPGTFHVVALSPPAGTTSSTGCSADRWPRSCALRSPSVLRTAHKHAFTL